MDSSSNRRQDEERRQAELRRQIALLQSQLKDPLPGSAPITEPPSTPRKKRKQLGNTLAPGTPSPKKQKVQRNLPQKASSSRKPAPSTTTQRPPNVGSRPAQLKTSGPAQTPTPSTVLTKLAQSTSVSTASSSIPTVTRSAGFKEPAAQDTNQDEEDRQLRTRDENMAVIEDLQPGPYEHTAPFDDPHFVKLEPNSGIRLSSRQIPYDDFQDYLRGRYYLSPSRLYSVIRLLPNKQGYDVPVEGDWVTIAVIAERGQLKYTKAPVGIGKDDAAGEKEEDDDLSELTQDAPKKPEKPAYQSRWKGKAKEEPSKPSGKRYCNLKLIDFGCRSKSSATSGKAIIRGDAFLSLLLFESDSVQEIKHDDGRKEKIYKGGSRGAFERMAKMKEGAVVALLNPRILRPFQRAADTPHPTDNILAVTPESIDSVAVLGHSQDLGMCTVTKRDGKICGGWCDKRVSDVCEWHVQNAIQSKRAGRAEFSAGTSGMTSNAKRKAAYDPARQWGLKPEAEREAGGSTYVVSGHIIGGSNKDMFVGEKMGRDAQAKASRVASKAADLELEKLLKRDKDGMKAVAAAREHGKKLAEQAKREKAELKAKKVKNGKSKEGTKDQNLGASVDVVTEVTQTTKTVKTAYSASLIRTLGFDPTGKEGRKITSTDVQNKLEALKSIQSSRKDIDLSARPGKMKSTVRAPEKLAVPVQDTPDSASEDEPLDFPDSDDDCEQGVDASKHSPREPEKMIDLDDSSDLEVETPAS